MLILALDTSTAALSVALHDGTDVVTSASVEDPRGHTERLAPLVEDVLDAGGAGVGDLTDIGVGTGPGPFTGLRVGLVTAVTMGYALGVPVHGVCSLDVVAHGCRGDLEGEILVATDARRREVYWARYALGPDGARRLTEPAVDRPADLTAEVRALPTAGAGPVLYPDLLPHRVGWVEAAAGDLAELVVAGLAEGREMPVEPLYLRRPDALTTAERAAR
ncbi:tRNA (adenosine(37)-N6)-threonylcarbamoyltransferase complex dimerization subunit type 1 TsaB [Phycicoccus sonneratiae]|uniref:tRNA (Adenosine(37)-N6)-threonylcarbamoyltransferase complex dimerization subunit type 1 TsaB n=1 Tax=Phycicoccus sonneratiae TaxID=2807628 RepID=A0ABS2CR73_9MICO|nr:tRNA (adenosine(37)-N6)-threonylcarbamoyltransferase complex dimerization subunit type 1 TsaB [Phycicoccus sonneraticus]MBM6401938.1 tRNA (adenosine(37)-N6)-threonylcarbamoyltransferase complex dimerization subunit type 1 TsaB [Phycicoccus sonneraticus]